MFFRASLLALLAMLPMGAAASPEDAPGPEIASQIAVVARHYRDNTPPLAVRACNGLVEAVLADAGLPLKGNVRTLYAEMEARGWLHGGPLPARGDVVFFDATYDSNNNGEQDDVLSHIAVVIAVDDDGTTHMVHHASKGIRPLTMNLLHPGQRRSPDGKVWNSYLGRPGYAEPGRQLAGELFRATASPGAVRPLVAAADTVREDGPEPFRPPAALPLSIDDAALVRALGGRALRAEELDGRTCVELWFLRNAIVARHGYAFTQPQAREIFELLPSYQPDEAVGRAEAWDRMSRRDRTNLERILAREEEYCD
jgi:hypothetical protein